MLGLELHAEQPGRNLFFRCGRGMLLLFNPHATAKDPIHVGQAQIPLHGTTGPSHLAFGIHQQELEEWRLHLLSKDVPIESEVTWPTGGHSIYFRDPAGNSLELATPAVWELPESILK